MNAMNKEKNIRLMKWIFPILSLILLVVDGRLTMMLSMFSEQRNICNVQLLVLLFIIGYFYFGNIPYIYIWATIVGMIYDLYYYGILGIHMFIFPLMFVILHYALPYVPRTVPTYLILFLLCSIWVIYANYFVQGLFNIIHLDLLSFMILYAAPTLLMSTTIYLIALIYGRRFFLKKSLLRTKKVR